MPLPSASWKLRQASTDMKMTQLSHQGGFGLFRMTLREWERVNGGG